MQSGQPLHSNPAPCRKWDDDEEDDNHDDDYDICDNTDDGHSQLNKWKRKANLQLQSASQGP